MTRVSRDMRTPKGFILYNDYHLSMSFGCLFGRFLDNRPIEFSTKLCHN